MLVAGGLSPAIAGTDSVPARWMPGRARLSWLEGLAVAVAAIVVLGFVHPTAYSSPSLRAVVETVMTLLALAAAGLVREQFGNTHRLRKLLVLGALLMLALTEFFGSALPAVLQAPSGSGFTAALPFGQLIVGAILVVAALTPSDRLIVRRDRALWLTAVLSLVGFGVAELAGLLLRSQLLAGATYSGLGLDHALHHPLGLVVLLSAVGLFACAGLEFARRGRLEGNSVLALLAGAALLLAAARLYYLTLPWISPEAISVREGFRLLAVGLIFAAALRQDLEIRASATRAAAMAERHRVAQDLHDGLAQDLAFIAAHGMKMAGESGDEHPVAIAAKRALAVSRDTISELSDMSSVPPREALEAIAHELGARFSIVVAVDVHRDVALASEIREHVLRIAREAIANAARHGHARSILVSLKRTSGGLVLRVDDDGCGMGSGFAAAAEGFGLRSMRDRAAALGGCLAVRPRRDGGTELKVVFR